MSELKKVLNDDMKNFMRAKDKDSLEALRLLIAKIKQKEIDERIECTDEQVIQIVTKMMKQGKDAEAQFKQAGRDELALKEQQQMAIFSKYLPEAIDDEALAKMVDEAVAEVAAKNDGVVGMQQMGAVMAILKPKCQGRADMGALSKLVRHKL